MKIGVISLGCDKNRVDSELILGLMHENKYEISPSIKNSDVVIINTCGFITSAKQESIDTILEVVEMKKPVVVTGCLVERYLEELKHEIPEVTTWVPIRDYYHFNKFMKTIDPSIDNEDGLSYEHRMISTHRYLSYLKIGEGCSNHCSYCAIPLIRGEYRSRNMDDLVHEAKRLAKTGVKELVVLEQDTTKYGIDLDDNADIVALLTRLDKIPGFEFIRLLYLYPDEISDELINFIASHPKITPYFDIPIQHSEDAILKAMNRRGSKKDLIELFTKIRNKIPNAVIRTTILVGFPGETDEDIANLVTFIKEMKFDHLGCFKYSPEEGTPSYDFPNQVDEETKENRYNQIMKTQQLVSYHQNKLHEGEIMKAVVIGKEKGDYLVRSYWNAPDDIDGKIYLNSDKKFAIGDIISIKIKTAFIYDLEAELI